MAGIGGAVGLKGSDGARLQATAKRRQGQPQAALRTAVFLQQLNVLLDGQMRAIEWFTWADDMGSGALLAQEITAHVLGQGASPSSGADTQLAAKKLAEHGIDLLIFAGGDGTARDILLAVDEQTMVLGLPAGVKMHSGVFAISPKAAAEVVVDLLRGGLVGRMAREVRDYVEIEAVTEGESTQIQSAVGTQNYGDLWVPESTGFLQQMKVGGVENESLAVAELTNYILEELALKKDRIVVFGPGSTCLAIKLAHGLEGTLLGCDAVLPDGEKLKDLTSADLLALRNKSALHLVLSFTRNQGFLFGRGNQQISSQLIRKLKISEDLTIVSSRTKLASLKGLPLLVDTGDTELDAELSGIYPILTGYDEFLLYRIAQDFQPED